MASVTGHDKESVADSFYLSHNSSTHSLDIAGNGSFDAKKRDEWKSTLTMAYEKGLVKNKCGFCKMYFHRDSVNFKVPNHRLYELEKCWGLKKEGRRYQSAAFLYRMVEVCKFCSQFFSQLPGEEKKLEDPLRPLEEKPVKLLINTEILRSDVAQRKRCYQSSEVDNKAAVNAVTPPYSAVCRTRRELDPWWEIDFGRRFHLLDLKFLISTGVRQQLSVNVFLLSRAAGFENPFLESISRSAILKREFIIAPQDVTTMQSLHWQLPENTICAAVRIQLQGIHSLLLQRFTTQQGDSVVPVTKLEMSGETTAASLATLSPQFIHQSLREMESPERRKEKIIERDLQKFSISDRMPSRSLQVPDLRDSITAQYQSIEDWKARVTECASIFSEQEVLAMYKVIFKYAADQNLHEKDAVIADYDLMGVALTFHYPRCQLSELSKRIRAVLSLIHQRSQLKQLMGLHNSENFSLVSSDSSYYVKQLNIVFEKLQDYWTKKETRERLQRAKTNAKGIAGTTAAEARGCSWSQFLIVMRYFCTQLVQNIPAMAFNVDFKKNSSSSDFNKRYSEVAGIAQYQKRFSQFGPSMLGNGTFNLTAPESITSHNLGGQQGGNDTESLAMSMPSLKTMSSASQLLQPANRVATPASRRTSAPSSRGNNGGNNSSRLCSRSMMLQSALPKNRLDALATPIYNRASQPLTIELEPPSLLEDARLKEAFADFDSRFSEYKFANFKRRVALEPTFPKTLSLEFARTLIPTRAATNSTNPSAMDQLMADLFGEAKAPEAEDTLNADGIDDKTQVSFESSGLFGEGSGLLQRSGTAHSLQRSGTAHSLQRIGTSKSMKRAHTGLQFDAAATTATEVSPLKSAMTPKHSALRLVPHSSSTKQLTIAIESPTKMSGIQTGKSGVAFWQEGVNPLSPLRSANAARTPNHRMRAVGRVISALSTGRSKTAGSTGNFENFSVSLESGNFVDGDDDSDDNGGGGGLNDEKKAPAPPPPVDFFKVCGLCEVRFPRHAMEIKVLRKHIVKLRDSWDKALVSKEIRLLDNTISMYNLVNVCHFCAQFFDPDFEGGIAYPVQIESPMPKQKSALTAILSQRVETNLIPYFDTRYPNSMSVQQPPLLGATAASATAAAAGVTTTTTAATVAAESVSVLARPQTVESRNRARRAAEIAHEFEERQQQFKEQILLNEKKNKK